jgi:hypothetical protein
MSLGKVGEDNEADAAVNDGDLMAFNWEDGVSVTSVNTSNSGLPGAGETAFTGDVDVGELSEVEGLSSEEEFSEPDEQISIDDKDESEEQYF